MHKVRKVVIRTDFLKNSIFAAFRRENARSVYKVTDFVDRHYLVKGSAVFCAFNIDIWYKTHIPIRENPR